MSMFHDVYVWLDTLPMWIGVLGIVIMLFLIAGEIVWLNRLRRGSGDDWIAEYATDQPLQTWGNRQEWRKGDTGVRLLNELRAALDNDEDYLVTSREAALEFRNNRDALDDAEDSRRIGSSFADYVKRSWFEWQHLPDGIDLGRVYVARKRIEQLERLWAGDAHIEIEDQKDILQELNQNREVAKTGGKSTDWYDKRILEVNRVLRDLDEIVRRGRERSRVSPSATKLREAQEIHANDVQHDITKTFLGARSQMEIFRERAKLIQQVTNDPSFTADEKKRLIAKIEELAVLPESNAVPSQQSKPGSIFKEGS